MPVPYARVVKVMCRVNPSEHARLMQLASQENRTLGNYVYTMLKQHLAEHASQTQPLKRDERETEPDTVVRSDPASFQEIGR